MREIVGAENGQVGVIGFQILVGVAVYDCQIIVVVFLAYKPSRVLAEGTDFIFKAVDHVVPGFAANETLLYSPELKFYSNRIKRTEGGD